MPGSMARRRSFTPRLRPQPACLTQAVSLSSRASCVLLTSSMTAERRAGRQGMAMHDAWIDGTPAELHTAAATAARLLDASRQPLIAGLGTDVAGARAAIILAQRIGAVIDHMNADALLRDL